MTIDVKLTLSDEIMAYLRREAENRKVSLDKVVSEVVEGYFDDPTREELLAGLRTALLEVVAGKTHPARELLAELKEEFGDDDDEG